VANMLWIRVDEYLHSSDIVSAGGDGHAHDADHEIDHDTSAGGPSARVSAPELAPLARLVTTLDPTFVRAGIVTGGALLRDTPTRREATEFLRGLVRSNPDHPRLFGLYFTLGNQSFEKGDFRSARTYLEKAVELFPRVLDRQKLARFEEPPADRT